MVEKLPASPSSAGKEGPPKSRIPKLGGSEVNESNIVPFTLDKMTPEQKNDLERYKMKLVADVPGTSSSKDGEVQQVSDSMTQSGDKGAVDGSQGVQCDGSQRAQGDGSQGFQGENLNQDGNMAQLQFNNFQDRNDYAVQHALINQSGVLVNTLSNMVKSMVDGSIAEYQATGLVYFPGGVFPNYRPLITNNQPAVQPIPPSAPSAQPTAPVSAPAPAALSLAPGQLINPRLLQQPIQLMPPRQQVVQPIQQTPPRQQVVQPIQQLGLMNASARFGTPDNQLRQHAANQVVPEHLVNNVQPDQMVVPQVISEHLVRNIWPNFQNYQGGNLNYQYQPTLPQVQYQQGGSAQPQFAPQYNQFEPMPQQAQGVPQQRPWADMTVDVMREQFELKPKDAGNLYQHPYPEWFERVPLPNQFKVPDFSKFSGQDNVSTYEHFSRFLAQCGEASAMDALRGVIAPIREKFSSQDFDSLSRLAQKVTLHEQRFAVARKSFKKVNHVCPYMYGSEDNDDDDSEIAAAEWVRSKKVIPCQWVKSSGKEQMYDFDITKADKIFDLLLREKQIQLPAGHTTPSAEELGKRRKLGRNAEDLIKTNMVLKDFGDNPLETKGVLNVELTVGNKTIPTTFFVIDGKGSYSLLLGRDRIHANCCIPSTMHQCLIQWQGDKIEIVPADRSVNVASADLALWEMDGDRPRPTFISKNISPEFRTKLIELLKEFRDCFAWEYYKIPGLSRSIVEHRLPIKPGVRPHQQPPRRRKANMFEPVKAKIKHLYDAGFIRPCRYAEWVSSIVPVIKKNGKKIQPPENKTELQEMIGKINFVRRFISNLSGRLEPFTPLLRLKADQKFTWGAEQQKALHSIKEYLSSPPVLIPPQKGIPFRLYLSAGEKSIGSVLIQELEGLPPQKGIPFRLYLSAGEKSIGSVLIQELEGKERVVFYLSRRLLDAETRYSPVEKLCLCLYFSCTRLRHYLLSNECTIICKADVVKYMLSAPILKGRVGKWIFSLTEFDLRYESPKAIKGQAIADFIVDHRDDSIGSVEIVPWTLFFDRSVCTHGCGIGLVIISPLGACFEFAYTIKPYATNNQAEYEAVLKGLQLLKEVEADAIEIMGNSLLVISQLAREYECKNDTLIVYNEKCRELMKEFRLVTLKHVSREQNIEANDLAQGASGYKPMIKDVKVEVAALTADDRRYDVHQYLQNPSQSASRKLRYKALNYTLLDDELYYRTIDGVLLKCLSTNQAKVAIGEDIFGQQCWRIVSNITWDVKIVKNLERFKGHRRRL
uniref:B1234D02.14 protein n=1 Tax=Oryza sativa subsp. japonica TaxID=39947 RepID=Q7XWM1_ORYSJ|nr:OSJNBb0052B05.8 [Oryza sativa Japonica Group]CAE75890.1 B1234D02.14 [Oryza sativa Japonica Group]